MFILKNYNNKILIVSLVLLLVSCGGGGSSTPPPPATDTTAPRVVATKPSSEQNSVKVISFIAVTFSEEIANVDTSNVSIYPFDANDAVSSTRLRLKADPFIYNSAKKTLTIKPEADFSAATKYQVVISGISDGAGNEMVGSCQWEFATTGFKDFGVGYTGVCGTEPPAVPNDPQNVNAVAGDGSVSISWQAPSAGSEVTYYKIEKSIDNAQMFSVVNGNVAASTLSYTDPNAQNGTSHIYKVSAGNDIGLSNGVNSNAVTPISTQVSVVPGAPQNAAAVSGDSTVTVSWSAPITGDTVAYYKLEKAVNGAAYTVVKAKLLTATRRYVDTTAQNGASHVYRITAGNAIGLGDAVVSNSVTPQVGVPAQARVELISQSPAAGNGFGGGMAFSPDGATLVIGEYLGDSASAINAGTAQIFTKANGSWARTQLLTAQTLVAGKGFGMAVAISQDGTTLAIGGFSTNGVDIYTKSGTRWGYVQTLAPSGTSARQFGWSVSFHPNSNLLAIGDYTARPNGITEAGTVQLFSKSAGNWGFTQELTAQLPAVSNWFGTRVKFSPDGSTLAVSETYGDPSTATDAGTVQLFTQNGTNWALSQVLISNAPTIYFGFGNGFGFSPDSNTLAIGEAGGNNVQLFTRAGSNWNWGQVLRVASAKGGFGVAVTYSADGATLAVGEDGGTSNGIVLTGNVYLFYQSGAKANWTLNRTLTAKVPTAKNQFGAPLYFSPVSKELVIGEFFGDTAAAQDAGVVHIIDLSQLP